MRVPLEIKTSFVSRSFRTFHIEADPNGRNAHPGKSGFAAKKRA